MVPSEAIGTLRASEGVRASSTNLGLRREQEDVGDQKRLGKPVSLPCNGLDQVEAVGENCLLAS